MRKFMHEPFAEKSCETCHAPAKAGKVVLTQADAKSLCVTCHDDKAKLIDTAKVPQGVALDKDGNVYVTDTLNNRVEIFDADGNFISLFGKHGDGPGYFARPKCIAVDGDGHIWVADEMADRLQVFNREGQLLTYVGTGHGDLPGQFKALVGVAVDKQNRVFTTEQYPGRLQMFRYVTDAEAAAEKTQHDEELQKAADRHKKPAAQVLPNKPAEASPQKAPDAPAQKDGAPPNGPVH